MGGAKIAHHVLLGVASFLVSDNDATLGAKHRQTTRHRCVIGKTPVAMQFNPVRETPFDVIQSKRPLSMARNLDSLPCGQVVVDLLSCFAKLCLQCFYCRIKIDIVLIRVILQILQSPFQFEDRSFKIQRLPFHEQ